MRKTSRVAAIGIFAVGAILLSGCHVLNQRDAQVIRDENNDVFGIWLIDTDFYNDGECMGTGPGNCQASDPHEFDAWDTIYADLDANCGPSGNNAQGDWGTPGDAMDPPDSTLVNCANAEIQDDPEDEEDPASFICYDTDPAPDHHDCQVDSTYTEDVDGTAYYRNAVNSDPTQFVTTIRDWAAKTAHYPEQYCVYYSANVSDWTFDTICPF